MTLPTHVGTAGKFPVQQIPCRAYVGPVLLNAPRAVVLHTTECTWSAALAEFKVKFAPQFLLGMNNLTKKVEIAQLIPMGQAGAALEHHNNLAMAQIEMVGFSQEKPWLPDADTLDALASLMLVLRDTYGVPMTHPYPTGDFGMYGYRNKHRDKFGKEPGWFGHGDVPDNSHWDPGNLSYDKIFARAEELAAAAAKPLAPAMPKLDPHPDAKVS